MRVRRTRDSPSNEVLRARTKPRFVRRQIFESPRNGKRKMRYLANTKRIHYPEKKCIRTKLDTCEKSFFVASNLSDFEKFGDLKLESAMKHREIFGKSTSHAPLCIATPG